jgi:hypothetical protein
MRDSRASGPVCAAASRHCWRVTASASPAVACPATAAGASGAACAPAEEGEVAKRKARAGPSRKAAALLAVLRPATVSRLLGALNRFTLHRILLNGAAYP